MKKQKLWALLMLMFAFLLSGCDSLPEADKKAAQAVPNTLKDVIATTAREKGAFEALQKSGEWEFLKPYSEKEKWAEDFVLAEKAITYADSLYKDQLVPLLEKNESKDIGAFQGYLHKIGTSVDDARNLASKPIQRRVFLLKARKEAPQWIEKARGEAIEVDELLSSTAVVVRKAKVDYSAKAADIDGRFAALREVGNDTHGALGVANKEFGKIFSGQADYAKLGDSTTLVSAKLAAMKDQKGKLTSKLSELYRSYTKNLDDMRIDYYVVIGRASWDDYSDWDMSSDYSYTRQVDESVFTFLDTNESTIATLSRTSIPDNVWDALRIDKKESLGFGDDSAEFWVDNVYTKTYHKYVVTENGKQSKTDWVEVAEDVYDANEGNLGMDIVSKPYGMYEEETIKSAVPPGFAYVGNPKYGKWEQNPKTGERQWSFFDTYAAYHMLFGGNNRYGYNDWSSWNRSTPYYGSKDDPDRYGTWGHATYSSGSHYGGSDYARKNSASVKEARESRGASSARSSGGQGASVRGAGVSSRSRGAGGGGK